ncbi:MAG TPA: hypothetical protein VF549_10760 [Solirubrobacteraceae bacterium]|jgi:hypothetical protein
MTQDCPNCGRSVENVSFCPGCGTRVDASEPVTSQMPPVETDVPIVALKRKKHAVASIAPPPPPPAAPPPMVVGPPPTNGGLPMTPPPAGPPTESFLVRHRYKILGGALGVTALAAVIVVVLLSGGGDSGGDSAATALASSRTEMQPALDEARAAEKIDDVNSAGEAAENHLAALETSKTNIAGVDKARYRAPATTLVDAEHRYLAGMAKLAELRDTGLGEWDDIHDELTEASKAVQTAAAQVQALDLASSTPVVPDQAALDGAIDDIDSVVTNAKSRLRAWRRSVRRWEAAKERQAGDAAQPAAYRSQMQAAIDDYFHDRDRTRAFFHSVDSLTPLEAKQQIASFRGDREQTISTMQALVPPASVTDEHQQMMSVVQSSLDGLNFADQAVEEYVSGPYDAVTETPAWAQFDARSTEVTNRFGPAKSAWQSAAGAATATGSVGSRPKKPDV